MSTQNEQQEKLRNRALSVTRWVGSPQSVVLHTLIFIGSFCSVWFGLFSFDRMLLVLTTIVSLEAIYLSIFIQMTINYTTESLAEVQEGIGEIQEDVQEVQEDIDEIQEDVGEIQEDVDEIQEDVDEIQEDVDELQEDLEEITEEDKEEEAREAQDAKTLQEIRSDLQKLLEDVDELQRHHTPHP